MFQRLLEVYESRKLRLKLISLGGKRVLDYSWSKCAKEHMRVYNLFT